MIRQDIKILLENREDLQKDLFIRGFLITDKQLDTYDAFPFYGNWAVKQYGKYFFASHFLTGSHFYEAADDRVYFLMGHAYNPFTMEHREPEILEYIAQAEGTPAYMDRINELTGVFVLGVLKDETLEYLVDPSGMQSACCGVVDGHFYLSSHAQLIGDLCGLTMDPLVQELVAYKWYRRILGSYLPGDLTPFAQVKRVVANMWYRYGGQQLSHKRFWPLTPCEEAADEVTYRSVIAEGSRILANNMKLIPRKWEKPWISLTGGIDSNTTFAAANGCYSRYETFSYISAEKEIPDAEAAAKISSCFGLKHHVYTIPDSNEDIRDFELISQLLRHNNGYISERRENETRKRLYLKQHTACDVEVKSWVSETVRGYWYKYLGRKRMPRMSPKLFRNLYKIFLQNRSLARKVDQVFADFIDKYGYRELPAGYLPADMHYHEVSWGSWGSLNISEMKYSHDMTIPYNNRVFLEQLLRVPLEKRISDQHHRDMKKLLNSEFFDLNIYVKNQEETSFRAFMLNVIFTINSILPF